MKVSARIASVLVMAWISLFARAGYGGRDAWTTSWSIFPAVTALAASPSPPSLLYAGLNSSDGGGFPSDLYSSRDDGLSWVSLDHFNYKNDVRAIVVAPTDPVTIFVGESGDLVYGVPASLIRSADEGKTWSPVGPGMPWGAALAIDPTDPQRIWLGFGGGLFVSDDGGSTWEPRAAHLFTGGVLSLTIDPGRAHAVFVSGYIGGAYGSAKSDDGGSTWQVIEPFACGGIAKFGITAQTGTVYAAEMFDGPCQAFTASDDGGLTWRELTFPATARFDEAGFGINPTLPEELVWASSDGGSISKDGGSTWAPLGAIGSEWAGGVYEVVFNSGGSSVHVAAAGRVFDYSFTRIVGFPARPASVVRHRP